MVIHSASLHDRDSAKLVLAQVKGRLSRLRLTWADSGYAGLLVNWVKGQLRCVLEIVKRHDDLAGFAILPRRWVVERTFECISRCRRLSKDYEALTDTLEAFVYLSMIA